MSQLHPVFNVVKLTAAPPDLIVGHHPKPPPPPEIVNEEEEWIVEEILDSKVINRKLCYLVKWEGFGIEHNSWEPWDDVHAPDLVADFYRKHPGAACQIQAIDFTSIPFRRVPGRHFLEEGVDVRGHSFLRFPVDSPSAPSVDSLSAPSVDSPSVPVTPTYIIP